MAKRRGSVSAIAVSAIALAFIGASVDSPKSWALLEDSPKALVDEAWQAVHREYVDRTFNRNDWMLVRQEYLKQSYTSKRQAYQEIQTMLSKLADPYTKFLEPQEIKDLTKNVSGDFIGVGLTVGLDEQTKEWIVLAPIKGSPAAAMGILPKDVIVKINGKNTPDIDPQQASTYLIGPVGSQVVLTARRGKQQLTFKLLREHIDLHPVTYRLEATAVGKIGYIRLPVFTSRSPKLMHQAIQALETQQVKGYILDLRSNPGGIFEASLAIAPLWLGKRPIVSVVDRRGKQDRLAARNQALTTKPLVVLINDKSASASEILAGALQDNRRATLVGTQTFGKGLVQSLEPLEDGSGLTVTVAKYYTPKGRDINKVGITPDIVVPLTEAQKASLNQERAGVTSSDPQYVSALTYLTQSIKSKPQP